MQHPIAGCFILGWLEGAHRVALAERLVRERESRQLFVVARLHGGPEPLARNARARYQGERVRVPVTTRGLRVLPGENEGWVEIADYLDFVGDRRQ